MGVQGFLPQSPDNVVHSSLAPLAQRPVLQNLQSVDASIASVQHSPAQRSVALAVGGGLSLSAFTVTWLGRRSQRRTRFLRRQAVAQSVAVPKRTKPCQSTKEAIPHKVEQRCLTCLERPRSVLDVHFLYASPVLRPGGSSDRLPPLNWQEEAAAIREALCPDNADADPGLVAENELLDSLDPSCAAHKARMQVNVATVQVLSRLAASFAPSGPTWWHIAAHSEPETGRLILEDEDGAPQAVSMAVQTFVCQKPPLGVSILACAGEQAGRALLSAGASFAIVASGELRDSTARMFATHFYRRLHGACAAEAFEPLKRTDSLADQVRLAFGAAKEALFTATNPAVRMEAKQLQLLERGGLVESPASSACRSPLDCLAHCEEPVGEEEALLTGSDLETQSTTCESVQDGASSAPCTSGTFPQDCEDFIGRGPDLQRLLQVLGAPGGRRVTVLHGPDGAGKSALGAELCRFATCPGRKFAPVKGGRRLAYVSLQDPGSADEGVAVACARLAVLSAAAGLATMKSSEGRLVRTCLLVDDAERQNGWQDEIVPELLDKNPQMCLLLLRRAPLYRLEGNGGERWKPLNLALGPLPETEAAQVFLRRLHRPIFPSDLSWETKKAGQPLRPSQDLVRQVAALPAVASCRGFPRKLVRLAAQVTWELPSLLSLEPQL
mmetsp:Transcript_46300/g.108480  ORF Transcript_46300/g.108480 Transcript_46300/m.108480 type:complete len:668 (+) Transcript_46300:69-2072(+)